MGFCCFVYIVFALILSAKQFNTPLLNQGRIFGTSHRNHILGERRVICVGHETARYIHELFGYMINHGVSKDTRSLVMTVSTMTVMWEMKAEVNMGKIKC